MSNFFAEMNKNDIFKYLILGAMIIYIVSPVDALPGPVDDAIVLLMGLAVSRRRITGGND